MCSSDLCLLLTGSLTAQQVAPAQQPSNLPAVPAALAGNPPANQAAAQPVRITATSLNGYWAGVGYLDEQKLEAKGSREQDIIDGYRDMLTEIRRLFTV